MSPEEKRQGTFVEFEQLLCSGTPIDEAIATVANAYDFNAGALRSMMEESFGNLKEHRRKMLLRANRMDRQSSLTRRSEELRKLASSRVQNAWEASVPFGGLPDWPHLLHMLMEELAVEDQTLNQIVCEAFQEKLRQLQTRQLHQHFREQNSRNA